MFNFLRRKQGAEPKAQETAIKGYQDTGWSSFMWGGLGGYNLDFTGDEQGAAAVYTSISSANAAMNAWQSWVGGLRWTLKNKSTGAIEYDSATLDLDQETPLFAESVNRFEFRYRHSFYASICFSDKLFAETYILKAKNRSNFVSDAVWLNPLWTMPIIIGGHIKQFQYSTNGFAGSYSPEQVAFRITQRNPFNDLRGYPPLLSAIDAANMNRNVKRSILAYFANGMQLGVIMMPRPEDAMTTPQAEDLAQLLRRRHKGTDNTGNNLVLKRNMEIIEPKNLVNVSENYAIIPQLRNEIMMTLGVPPAVAGDSTDVNYDNAADVLSNWHKQQAIPYAKSQANWLNTHIIPLFGDGVYLEFDVTPFEVVKPETISTDLNAGIVDIYTAQERRGYKPDERLKNIYVINGVPMSVDSIVAQAGVVSVPSIEALPADASQEDELGYTEIKAAPPNTTFDSVTYNGVTVQASPMRPSSRDDKKYMRWVRYKGEERLIHWGSPDMDVQRDIPERQASFNARHKCDTRKDPMSASFWACWHWSNPRSEKSVEVSAEPTEPDAGHVHDEHCEHHHDLPHEYLFDDEELYPSDVLIAQRTKAELVKWYKFLKKQGSAFKSARVFETDTLEPYVKHAVIDRIEALPADASQTELSEAIIDVLHDEAIKSKASYRRSARQLAFDLWKGRIKPREYELAMFEIIEREYTSAFNKVLRKSGLTMDTVNAEARVALQNAIVREIDYIPSLIELIGKTPKTGNDRASFSPVRNRLELWIARYDSIENMATAAVGGFQKLRWVRNPRKESCGDCIQLDQRVYTKFAWSVANIHPQSPRLECFGSFCGCMWVEVSEDTPVSTEPFPTFRSV